MFISGFEIGVDCVEISRFDGKSRSFFKKIFTDSEREYCENKGKPIQHYAGKFAGKESLIKAMSCFNIKLNMSNIEILNKSNGQPFVKLSKNLPDLYKIKISLSHSDTIAIAMTTVTKIVDS